MGSTPRCPQRNICTYTLEIGQREWVLRAVPPVGYFNVTGPRGSTYVLLMGLLLTGGLVTFIFFRQRHLEEVERLADCVQKEKENAARLLLNILPKPVAEELKQDGEADPVHHGSATVLFADFVDFTRKAERLSADTLIDELHHLFLVFDRIVEHHGLVKIKTIGDAYMAAGGVPAHSGTHAEDCARAGLDMVRYLQAFNRRRTDERAQGTPASDDPPVQWALRVGISTGPLIAGVIGTAKFTYDVFGDTVGTASRMESSGVPGRVNIFGVTREHIYGSFECEARGKTRAKGKGKIDMYLVEGGRDAAPSLEDALGDERP